ncbi:MAG TPA: hypothetical protein VIW24_01495 [Aldersonia sp.]
MSRSANSPICRRWWRASVVVENPDKVASVVGVETLGVTGQPPGDRDSTLDDRQELPSAPSAQW